MPLLTLPPELRSQIYTHLSAPSSPTPTSSCHYSSACATALPSTYLALLLTSRQLAHEVSTHYHHHHHTHIQLDCSSRQTFVCNPAKHLSGHSISTTQRASSYPLYLRECRNLVIDISTTAFDHSARYVSLARQIARLLASLPAVTRLHVRLSWPWGRQAEGLERFPRKIWDAVEGLEGLASVVFVLGEWGGRGEEFGGD